MSQWMTKLWNWVIPTFEFDFSFGDEEMSYVNPKNKNRRIAPIEEDYEQTPMSLEEEIMSMEQWKKELIKKYGADNYNRKMRTLVRRKQEKYNKT
jgi:hypothetical protein